MTWTEKFEATALMVGVVRFTMTGGLGWATVRVGMAVDA
jgi:hypothetical protein